MKKFIPVSVCLIAAFGFAIVCADPPKPSATSPTAPSPITSTCNSAEFRQFDFWVGSWTVRNSAGKEIGTSQITQVSAGCAILEQWTAANGMTGISINYFDPHPGQWHQDWVGSRGAILHLQGRIENGAMVLSDASNKPSGTTANRIIWTALPDGKVKQEWSTSTDAGKTWATTFVGFYER